MNNLFESTFNAVFFLSGATIFCGGLGVLMNYCFKSKCRECIICGGMLHIIRDIQAENEETKMELDHIPRPPNDIV
jgi:hypothetical protein